MNTGKPDKTMKQGIFCEYITFILTNVTPAINQWKMF
jgi:hypothetical protein